MSNRATYAGGVRRGDGASTGNCVDSPSRQCQRYRRRRELSPQEPRSRYWRPSEQAPRKARLESIRAGTFGSDDELRAGAQELPDPGPGLAAGDHQAGLADELGTAQGQQALVSGSRTDQRDAADRRRRIAGWQGGTRGDVHDASFPFIVRTWGTLIRLPAPSRSNRAATSRPSCAAAPGLSSPRARST